MGGRHLGGWHGDFDSLAFSETSGTALTSEEQPSLASPARRQRPFAGKACVIPTPRTHPNPLHRLVNLNSSSIIPRLGFG